MVAGLALPSSAATPRRTDVRTYVGSGGLSVGAGTVYASSSPRPALDDVGLVRSVPRRGERSVVVSVADGTGAPIAVRLEEVTSSGLLAQVSCDGRRMTLSVLTGVRELRVTPLAGLCVTSGTHLSTSVPTAGQVTFSYR